MIAVVGTYKDGVVTFEQEVQSAKPVKVIVTFLEEVETQTEGGLQLSDFSFFKTRELLKDFKGSFAETVIIERGE